jgi:hypothetical protein
VASGALRGGFGALGSLARNEAVYFVSRPQQPAATGDLPRLDAVEVSLQAKLFSIRLWLVPRYGSGFVRGVEAGCAHAELSSSLN